MNFSPSLIANVKKEVFEKVVAPGNGMWLVVGLPMSGRSTLLATVAKDMGGKIDDFEIRVVNLPEEVDIEIEEGKKYVWVVNSIDSVVNEKREKIWRSITAAFYQHQENHRMVVGQGVEEVVNAKELLGGGLYVYYSVNRYYLKLTSTGGYQPLIDRMSQAPGADANDQVIKNIFEILWDTLTNQSQEQLLSYTRLGQADFSDHLRNLEVVVESDGEWKLFSDIFVDWLKLKMVDVGLKVEERDGKLWLGDSELSEDLSFQEYSVLERMWQRKGTLVSRNEVGELLWGKDVDEKYSDWAIDQLLSKLRKKIGDGGEKRNLKTVKGQGFIFSQE